MTLTRSTFVLSLLLICPALAVAQSAPGCGPSNVTFDVSTTKSHRPSPTPQSGKAIVYFLQDDLKYNSYPRPTTRFGIDGSWVGATHANSYFFVYVDPGKHHLCANWQSDVTPFQFGIQKRSTSATSFTAEAGKTYYFRARDTVYTDAHGNFLSNPYVQLSRVNSDEAQAILGSFSFASSHKD